MDRLPESLPLPRPEKILDRHLQRLAVVYVRQSTVQQMMDHRESTNLQYGLVNRAIAMGWPEGRVLLIDEDLGKSASSAEGREGSGRWIVRADEAEVEQLRQLRSLPMGHHDHHRWLDYASQRMASRPSCRTIHKERSYT